MARFIERQFQPRKLADIRYDPVLQQIAHDLVNHPNAKEINWAVLDFAAIVCKARNPRCENCPMQETCNYFKQKC